MSEGRHAGGTGLIRAAVYPGLPLLSAVLYLCAGACHLWKWDQAAVVTVVPFWFWGLAGCVAALVSWRFVRRRLSLVLAGVWAITAVAASSGELRPLARGSEHRPLPGPPAPWRDGSPVLRVVSFNCAHGIVNPKSVDDLIPWQPDIVLLQETVMPGVLQTLAARLCGRREAAGIAAGPDCSIVARGRILSHEHSVPPRGLVATIQLPGRRLIQVASVHLSVAEKSLRFYEAKAVARHAEARRRHRRELARILDVCEGHSRRAAPGAAPPWLIGGDFNAPAGDAIYGLLRDRGFRDSFAAAGAGWGGTYSNLLPVLRIDSQWVGDGLVPVRAAAVRTTLSDHRMVVCDYVLTEEPGAR